MPQLEQNKQYSHRHCAVYTSMDTLLAKRLAAKHNYAATNSHEMTTWDWVSDLHSCGTYVQYVGNVRMYICILYEQVDILPSINQVPCKLLLY